MVATEVGAAVGGPFVGTLPGVEALFAGTVRAPRGSSREQSVTPTLGGNGQPVPTWGGGRVASVACRGRRLSVRGGCLELLVSGGRDVSWVAIPAHLIVHSPCGLIPEGQRVSASVGALRCVGPVVRVHLVAESRCEPTNHHGG